MGALNTVAIVGTGPSVANQKIEGDRIIAINSALEIVKPTHWFSLDTTIPDKIYNVRMPGVTYMVAFPDWKKAPPGVHRYRRIEGNHARPYDLTANNPAQYWMWRWSAMEGLSEHPDCVHTGNSAYGALNIAYHWRPKKIILYGIDASIEERVTGGYPNVLEHLPLLFASALPQLKKAGIQVYNASPISKVTCFLRLPT